MRERRLRYCVRPPAGGKPLPDRDRSKLVWVLTSAGIAALAGAILTDMPIAVRLTTVIISALVLTLSASVATGATIDIGMSDGIRQHDDD